MKVKIAHLISSLHLGGVEKGIQLSINDLNLYFNYQVYTLSKKNTLYIGNGYLNAGKYKNLIFSFFLLLNKLRSYKPDILISSLWKVAFISIVYKKIFHKKVVLVAFIHSETYFHFFDRFFIKQLLKAADAVAFDSRGSLMGIKTKSITAKKTYIIPYIFSHNNGFIKNITNKNIIRFLFAGRITEIKNIEATLLFFKLAKDKNINFIFDIYGLGDIAYIKTLQLLIDKYQLSNNIFFKGVFDNTTANSIFNSYHFYIQFSKNEGMAMSVVDAMLCGLVPIVTPVGEIKNYVNHLTNGLLLSMVDKEYDYAELLKNLVSVISQPLLFEKMSYNALSYFKSQETYLAAFTNMINDLDNCYTISKNK